MNDRLLTLRNNKNVNQKEVADYLQLTRQAYSRYERGEREPDFETLKKLAKYFNVSIDYLLGINEEDERIKAIGGFAIPNDKYAIPLVGQVVCGKPIESPENLEGYVHIDFNHPEEYFALRVKGDSMVNAGITPNALLIVHKQNYAEDGDVVVVAVNNESTTKRFKKQGDIIFLLPENPNYQPILVTEKDNFYIFGKVVQVRTDF